VTLYFAGGAMELSPDQYMIQQEVGVCLFSTISPSQTLLSLFSSNQTLQILRIEVQGLNLLLQNEEVFSCGRFQHMNLPICQTLRPESLAELQQKQSLLFVLVLFLSRALRCSIAYTFEIPVYMQFYCIGWFESTTSPGYPAYSILGGAFC
jgi:hypothetical protein